MTDKIKSQSEEAFSFLRAFVKWLVAAGAIGVVGGLIGAAFHVSVEEANTLRAAHPWLLWLLPAGGAAIAALYRVTKTEGKGTNAIIDSIHFGRDIPILLVPVIFVSTVITHLVGGSAGREGAALQIGGGLGCRMGRLLHLDEKEQSLSTLCGMSAVFSALFGTPVTATIFALEVCSVGVIYYSGLVPCLAASLVAYWITRVFGIAPTRFAVTFQTLTPDMLWRVAVLAVLCAAVSVVFCESMHASEHLAQKWIKNPYLRAAAGGVMLLALTALVGTYEYNGAGMAGIARAVELGSSPTAAFLWKLIFTAVTLSFGFKGGEVVPTFFIGATFGCVVGPLLGIPAGFAASVGLIAVFCGAVNCPVASIVLSVELFGSSGLIYYAAACCIAYMLSGYSGLYQGQRIMYSKLKAEYINITAK